ncbi:hypothetical protein ACU686_02320 [Yinghuangia aomiensis]
MDTLIDALSGLPDEMLDEIAVKAAIRFDHLYDSPRPVDQAWVNIYGVICHAAHSAKNTDGK